MSYDNDVILKDGSKVLVSAYKAEDFEGVVKMFASLSSEALRWGTPPYTREVIGWWTQDLENSIILVAHFQNRIVGYCMVHGNPRPRYRGMRELMIYLHQDFQDKGLGTAMTSMAVRLAREQGVHRLSLEVVSDNKIAIHVYEKVGFKIEGIMKDAFYGEDEKYHDMVAMSLLL
jgi:RimJ/RimL family protein N-acetyltransferase